jgi:uncharacterized protein YbjT (DUF2867 family)
MILVTGGTGFVGQTLVRHLIANGKQVRTLLRPSKITPQLPRGISVEAAVCSLQDERGLRSVLKDVDTIYHLAGSERKSSKAALQEVDVAGTQVLTSVAAQSNVRHIIFLSHLGADRASAYPVFKAKGMAENVIVNSGLTYTILRSAPIYGPGDQFTIPLARLLRLSPGFFLLPGEGDSLLQPIWIEDVVNCLIVAADNPKLLNQTISIGGVEAISLRDILTLVMNKIGINRRLVSLSAAYLRLVALFMEQFRNFPVSIYWLDYLSADRTTQLDSVPRNFGILPTRMHTQLDYLISEFKIGKQQRGFVL